MWRYPTKIEVVSIKEYLQGYEYIADENTGKTMAVRRATGEITEAVQCCLPVGTISYTPESQELYKERKEREQRNELRRAMNNPLGNFYFIPISEQFANIPPETVTRLIYLNTFVGYDNKLMLTERTPMKRKDLAKILNVSKSTISRFWKEVSPAYITESDSGLIFSNNIIFKRGSIKTTKGYVQYQKFYINGIRKLYEATERNNHRQLGYLFKLLPFINLEYNMLCYNPLETAIEKIELISIADFCKMIGYDIAHLNKLMYIYRSIQFDVGGRYERFCAITYDGVNKNNAKIFVNPHILYCGSDYNRVEILGAFCKN